MTFAVFRERIFGSILVSLPVAVIILGLLAGIVSALVNYMTILASLTERRAAPG